MSTSILPSANQLKHVTEGIQRQQGNHYFRKMLYWIGDELRSSAKHGKCYAHVHIPPIVLLQERCDLEGLISFISKQLRELNFKIRRTDQFSLFISWKHIKATSSQSSLSTLGHSQSHRQHATQKHRKQLPLVTQSPSMTPLTETKIRQYQRRVKMSQVFEDPVLLLENGVNSKRNW